MIDAKLLGYGLVSIILYWTVLVMLHLADRWAIGREWRVWARIALKIVVVIAAEFVVSLGVVEVCNAAGAACHRLVSPISLDAIVIIAFGATIAVAFEIVGPVRSYFRVRHKVIMRVGAYSQALEKGMSPESARAYSDKLYPLSPEDLLHEERLRQRHAAKRHSARTT